MNLTIIRRLACVVILSPILVGQALMAEDVIQSSINNILQRQQQIENHRMQQNQKGYHVFTNAQTISKNKQSSNKNAPCINVKQVGLLGASVLRAQAEAILQQSLLHKCSNSANLQNALTDISNLYIEHGYITSRAFVKPQDMSQGRLVVSVFEGKLDSIYFNSNERYAKRKIKMSIPRRKDELFNLRDVEQGLEQMNRLQSNGITMDVMPSKKPGYSNLQLKNSSDKRAWTAHFSRDNHGSESRGTYQNNIGLAVDNIAGINDNLYLSITRSEKQTVDDGDTSQSLSYTFPYGHWLLEAGVSKYRYQSRVSTPLTTFLTTGKNITTHVQAKKMLKRDQKGKLQAFAKLTHKEVNNFLEDVKIDVSSYKLTNIGMGVQHTKMIKRGQLNSVLSWTKGLNALGADSDQKREYSDEPEAQFDKLNLSVNLSQRYAFKKQALTHSVSLNGQYSDSILYPTEKTAIGGQYTVRGYENYGESSNSGWYLRNELSTGKTINLGQQSVTMTPYLGLDIGRVKGSSSHSALKGGALGIRVSHNKADIDLSLHQAIEAPDGVSDEAFMLGKINLRF